MPEKTIAKANAYIHEYVHKTTEQAYLRVEKERKGEGCGCRNCRIEAVADVNSWVNWIAFNTAEDLLYKYDGENNEIIPPYERPE